MPIHAPARIASGAATLPELRTVVTFPVSAQNIGPMPHEADSPQDIARTWLSDKARKFGGEFY
jgi:hypothetical protein